MNSKVWDELERRHKRKVIAGEFITHDGDCRFYSIEICTCGLFHFVLPYVYTEYIKDFTKFYPGFKEDYWKNESKIDRIEFEIENAAQRAEELDGYFRGLELGLEDIKANIKRFEDSNNNSSKGSNK